MERMKDAEKQKEKVMCAGRGSIPGLLLIGMILGSRNTNHYTTGAMYKATKPS